MTKKKRVVVAKKPKPRNGGTMTESGFWSFIRSTLRQKSRWWKPILQSKELAKRQYQGPNKKQKYEYQCNCCKQWYPAKDVNVDHIIPAGNLQSGKDLEGFVERLFCEVDNLQVLCISCHDMKSKNDLLTMSKK